MDHLVQSMEFKIDFTYNKLMAGLKMFQPKAQTYWEDDSVDVSLTRIYELITRIGLQTNLHNFTIWNIVKEFSLSKVIFHSIWENRRFTILQLSARIKSHIVTPDFDAMVQAISDIREWKRPLVSIGALIGWLLFINFFQLWVSSYFSRLNWSRK